MREISKKHYSQNKERYKKRNQINNPKAITRLKEFVCWLKQTPCTDCKRSFPSCVMDFDHLDPTLKTERISRMINSAISLQKLQKELLNCEVVCANCHRIRTQNRLKAGPIAD